MDLAPKDLQVGDRVISMPADQWKWPGHSVHWFEAEEPGWFGVVPHVGGLHLAQLRIAESMAKKSAIRNLRKNAASGFRLALRLWRVNIGLGIITFIVWI